MESRGNGMGNRIRLPVSASFNILELRAKTIEELVVIEVMREVYGELAHTQNRMAS